MIRSVIFDLGNTLISYYTREQFPSILNKSIENCRRLLEKENITYPDWKTVQYRVQEQNHGSPGDKVYPLEERIRYIFGVDDACLLNHLCDTFMMPILETGHLHSDVKPVLSELKNRGYGVAVLSNTPWGCPSRIWKRELDRFEITELVDHVVCCYDVGWRKPDSRVFSYLIDLMDHRADECLFVGDDPRWDVRGPMEIGMDALIIDRNGVNQEAIHGLDEIFNMLQNDTV